VAFLGWRAAGELPGLAEGHGPAAQWTNRAQAGFPAAALMLAAAGNEPGITFFPSAVFCVAIHQGEGGKEGIQSVAPAGAGILAPWTAYRSWTACVSPRNRPTRTACGEGQVGQRPARIRVQLCVPAGAVLLIDDVIDHRSDR